MFLSSLGVDRETVIRDYLPSGDNIRPKYIAEVETNPIHVPQMQSRREYLESAFGSLTTNSVEWKNIDRISRRRSRKMHRIYLTEGNAASSDSGVSRTGLYCGGHGMVPA